MKVSVFENCYSKQWRGLIVPDAFSHPAKFSPGLIQKIYQHCIEHKYIEKGQIVGDPFGGVGCGGIFAAYAGIRWIGVELEQKFVDLTNQNFDLHRAAWESYGYPEPVIIQGDSRRFSEIIGQCEGIITSPPFMDSVGGGGDQLGLLCQGKAKLMRSDRGKIKNRDGFNYGQSPGQIGVLKAGRLDSVITSPPYADSIETQGGIDPTKSEHKKGGPNSQINNCDTRYGNSEGQIGTLKSGDLDSIITSPPYADSVNSKTHGIDWSKTGTATGNRKRGPGCKQGETFNAHLNYSADPNNIGSLKVDSIVTSPPYEGKVITERAGHLESPRLKKKGLTDQQYGLQRGTNPFDGYGTTDGNLGNTNGESYWEAMRIVYSECHKALKPGGYLIVVVKAYIKNKRRVPLPQQTLKLLIHLGFEPVERIKAMLTQKSVQRGIFGKDIVTEKSRKSFFRRLAESKGSPKIDWEEVLVVRKNQAEETILNKERSIKP